MTKTSELLRAAKAKIEDPKRWTKGDTALDSRGERVGARDATACCWCSMGALSAAGAIVPTGDDPATCMLRRCIMPRKPYGASLVEFNDAPATTHADVMALFERAIAMAESEEG